MLDHTEGRQTAPPLEGWGLVRRFRQGDHEIRAVDGVEIEIAAGELVVIMGPSGSGKSTLLHLLGGIDRPDEGIVRLEGHEISSLNARELALVRRRRLGFMLQFFSLLPTMTALENVAFPLLLDGIGDALARAERELARVGLERRTTHRPAELSGGEQQRVALARALVVRPAVVLADEPTGNLDSINGREILALLREAADEGQSVALVTHDTRAGVHADRVVQLADGALATAGSAAAR
jgi:putative ABC transport system ATP-binding protein